MELYNIVEICVAIDIAIISIAYPIIIDKASSIGDKYSSQYISVLFGLEFPQKSIRIKVFKMFKVPLIHLNIYILVFSLLFLILKFEPLFGWDNFIVNNSAKIIVLVLSISLVYLFFTWLNKLSIYSGELNTLLRYIIEEYNNSKEGTDIKNYQLKAINEIAYYAIEKSDQNLQETLAEFYSVVFANFRKGHDKTKPIIYPIDLYFLVNRLNEISLQNER